MRTQLARHNRPVSDTLHPGVYAGMSGLVLVFVVSAWLFFGGGYNDLALAVVTGFFLMAAGIPFLIWLAWRRQCRAEAEQSDRVSFAEWAAGDFETGTGRRRAWDALIECLLPIAAVGLGLAAIGIIFYITELQSSLL
jgi:hypothetical protein